MSPTPETDQADKSSELAYVRRPEAIPCSRWSPRPSIYRMTARSAQQPVALEIGSRLGHYNVTALIGEGGMGQVYQATDTKLKRQVALKILPEAFSADPERLARFQREAEVLASLNHPNIGHIYGLEEAEGIRALVLELIEGPTLADRIKQGPIPLDGALPSHSAIEPPQACVRFRAQPYLAEQGTIRARPSFGTSRGIECPRDPVARRESRLNAAAVREIGRVGP